MRAAQQRPATVLPECPGSPAVPRKGRCSTARRPSAAFTANLRWPPRSHRGVDRCLTTATIPSPRRLGSMAPTSGTATGCRPPAAYKRSARELWKFCGSGGSEWVRTVSTLELLCPPGEIDAFELDGGRGRRAGLVGGRRPARPARVTGTPPRPLGLPPPAKPRRESSFADRTRSRVRASSR